MNNAEKQLVISSYIGDCYWMRQKTVLRLKFGGYNKEYLNYKRALISTCQKSKLWASKNRDNILYEFTMGKSALLNKIKEYSFWEVLQELGDMHDLGFALQLYDNGSFHKTHKYYVLSIGKEYGEKFAKRYSNYLFNRFNIKGAYRKMVGCRGYFIQFAKMSTPKIAKILKKFPIKSYSYKIPSSETISDIESRVQEYSKRNST